VRLGAKSDAGVLGLLDPESPVRRHYEELADNLLRMGGTGSVVVTSPEPGTGRTSICLVDCNLENAQLHRMLGEPNFVGLTSGLDDSKPLEHFGYEIIPGLLVVPTGPILLDPASLLEDEGVPKAVRGLQKSRDLVLLDAPVAARVLRSPNLLGGFDGVLLVVHASRTPRSVARETTDDLLEAGANLLGVVLNGCS
jgi:Mrp family chromosome partitioning ATPase